MPTAVCYCLSSSIARLRVAAMSTLWLWSSMWHCISLIVGSTYGNDSTSVWSWLVWTANISSSLFHSLSARESQFMSWKTALLVSVPEDNTEATGPSCQTVSDHCFAWKGYQLLGCDRWHPDSIFYAILQGRSEYHRLTTCYHKTGTGKNNNRHFSQLRRYFSLVVS